MYKQIFSRCIVYCINQTSGHRDNIITPTTHLPDMTAIHRFAAWAEAQHIHDLRDVSTGDGRLYLAAQKKLKGTRMTASFLRSVFEILVEAGALTRNPFPLPKDDRVSREATLKPTLDKARRINHEAERDVRTLLFSETGVLKDSLAAALNHFVNWLEFEQIASFSGVTTETLLRYRELSLRHVSAGSRQSYSSHVSKLFRELYTKGHIKENPAAIFRGGTKIGYTPLPAFADITDYLTKRSSRAGKPLRILEINYSENFSDLDIDAMPFGDRLILARFIDIIEKGIAIGTRASLASFFVSKADDRWVRLQQIGAVQINMSSEARCTSDFIKRYFDGDRLRSWGHDFLARYDANVKLFETQKQILPTARKAHRLRPRTPENAAV